ncbi:MAG: AbrB/MazE/SpoVT family DNA-binding domain-containing protein [Leptolyngbya sp. SIO1E4]|nr:AbrB/MazE/SpoVT family DNA-binding domain-containing protein [Leptolyngbya sp. SIO1E4]
MGTAIRTRVVKIGNSQGIRIPKPLLEQSGISEEVEIEIQEGCLILRATGVRAGWEAAFAAMAEHQDDRLLDDGGTSEWELQEWQW